MDHLPQLGRLFIVMGAILLVAGVLMLLAPRVPFLGRLPGDLVLGNDRFTLYIPIVTMVLLSVLLTVVINLIPRIFK